MRGTVLYGPRDIRFEDRETPKIIEADRCRHPHARPHASADRTCGRTAASNRLMSPTPMGHEYCGFVEEVGREVKNRQAGPVRRRLVCHLGQHLSSFASTVISPRASNASS